MVSLNTINYYRAVNGESSLDTSTWYLNYDKRHAFKIYSDSNAINPSAEVVSLSPSISQTESISIFSDQLSQIFNNTKIVSQEDGTERVELELADRVVTIIMDQSGSMLWNDNSNLRHQIAQDIVNKIEDNYPGNITYNLIKYGSDFVNVVLFGVLEEEVDVNDTNSMNEILGLDEGENYSGVRVVRTTSSDSLAYTPSKGDLISDGFIGTVIDTGLVEGQDYYYWVYTYNQDLKVSEGEKIKVVPRTRNVPRGVSIFRSFIETDNISEGSPLIGRGIYRDDNTIGLWHCDEGKGNKLFDFSNSNLTLTLEDSDPIWYDPAFVPSGISGISFNGETDWASASDPLNKTEIDFTASNNQLTIALWIYPYSVVSTIFMSRDNGSTYNYVFGTNPSGQLSCTLGGEAAICTNLAIELYKWQYVSITYNGGTDVVFRINNRTETRTLTGSPSFTSSANYNFYIGNAGVVSLPFRGRITEVSLHNSSRSSSYLTSQLESNEILDGDGVQIGTEYTGKKEDNGDRLVVLKYEIPDDYNFSGGQVSIVRNSDHIPSWEEDGDIIYQTSASSGEFFVADPLDFVLGENYYYRIYSQNSDGNFSFDSDSPSVSFVLPSAISFDDFPPLDSVIPSPEEPLNDLPSILPGNRKVYIRWSQESPVSDMIARTKIFYSTIDYPVVDKSGKSNSQLVFSGLSSDRSFVHRDLENDMDAFYTVVNIDKYGRSSGYDSNGNQVINFMHLATTPTADADESTFPLMEVSNLRYELIDSDSVSIMWDQPVKHPEDIDAYFDQSVIIYASITDQFGSPIPEDSPIKMYISANITRDTQADNVFLSQDTTDFDDRDAYDFFVARTDEGILKATLRMADSSNIISQIREAKFEIQVKSYIPRDRTSLTGDTAATNALEEYASILTDLTEGETSTTSSDNIFEFLSKKITVNFTNPWEVELINRDNAFVAERCYVQKTDEITQEKTLTATYQTFNGIYMKASAPFVARAKVTYKGEPVSSGSVDIAVWDADSDNLCQNAGISGSLPYEGEKIKVSTTVTPPENRLPILSGEEERIVGEGTVVVPISYVDIPLYAPQSPQAVRLFVRASNAGFHSVKDLYILFQNILQIDIQASSPQVDGHSLAEQQAQVFMINPDYPNFRTNSYDRSLVSYPDNNTVVQWRSVPISGERRNIYSIDNVSIPNGVYSYTRSGVARNVFMGPIQQSSTELNETHEISATVVYNGLSATAKQYVRVKYNPTEYGVFGARFLMEIDGGWVGVGSNLSWMGGGWLGTDGSPMWTDGIDYRRVKISRNPAIVTTSEFRSAACFRGCAEQEDSSVLELSSGQIVYVTTGDDLLEILHGDIYEETDPYTGRKYLRVGREGFVSSKEAYIELNDQSESDTTYFYIRANKFVPDSGPVNDIECNSDKEINDCTCLGTTSGGLTACDLPKWNPVTYISGTTTLFINSQPTTLVGGGDFYNGIPPCPICLKEPLSVSVVSRLVTNNGDTFEVGNNEFVDEDGHTLLKHDSDIFIKLKVSWRREAVPDDTPVYVSIGDNTVNNLFVASRDVYYTEIDPVDEQSYVTVSLFASKVPEVTTTEDIEIFSVYDENGRTARRVGAEFSLTIDREDETLESEDNPSVMTMGDIPVLIPYSKTMERYNVLSDQWDTVSELDETKGNVFVASVNNEIYVIGGLKNNNTDISIRTDKYYPIEDRWESKVRMITPRFGGMTIAINEDIYTIGGIGIDDIGNGEVGVSGALEVYHTSTNTWEALSSMPTIGRGTYEEKYGVAFGTAQHVQINGGNYIYVLCGINSLIKSGDQISITKYNDRILRYSVENDEWEYSDILYSDERATYSRISPLSIFFDSKIIVFNGAIDVSGNFIYPPDDFCIDITDPIERPGSQRYIQFGSSLFSDFPIPKYQAAIARYDDNPSSDPADYYIFGGSNNDSLNLDIVEKVRAVGSQFTYESSYDSPNISQALNPLLAGKHGMGAVYCSVSGIPYIYIIGGYTAARGETAIEISFG